MSELAVVRPLPLLVGEPDGFEVTLVGCGGTGSFLALDLARLAWHARERGVTVRLTFVDPDVVERSNVGRQNFAPAEIGQPKAEALARRFNRGFGLDIHWATTPFAPVMVGRRYSRDFRLLIGAVDNAPARRTMADAVEQAAGRLWWLDCGNLRASGQVLLGNLADWSERVAFPGLGFCRALPSPHRLRRGLLLTQVHVGVPSGEETTGSCADLVAREAQSLMINRAVATFAGQYVYDLLVRRRLDVFMTLIDLESGFAFSVPITPGNVARELGEMEDA